MNNVLLIWDNIDNIELYNIKCNDDELNKLLSISNKYLDDVNNSNEENKILSEIWDRITTDKKYCYNQEKEYCTIWSKYKIVSPIFINNCNIHIIITGYLP